MDDITEKRKYTEEDFDAVWHYHATYFLQALNGEDTIENLRECLDGLIGSKYDPRTK